MYVYKHTLMKTYHFHIVQLKIKENNAEIYSVQEKQLYHSISMTDSMDKMILVFIVNSFNS
jgi:hypothetical protein